MKLHRQRHKLYLTQHWGNLLVTAAQETGGIRDALENNKKKGGGRLVIIIIINNDFFKKAKCSDG